MPNLPHELSIITITAGQECTGNYADVRFNLPRLENDKLKKKITTQDSEKVRHVKIYIFLFSF